MTLPSLTLFLIVLVSLLCCTVIIQIAIIGYKFREKKRRQNTHDEFSTLDGTQQEKPSGNVCQNTALVRGTNAPPKDSYLVNADEAKSVSECKTIANFVA